MFDSCCSHYFQSLRGDLFSTTNTSGFFRFGTCNAYALSKYLLASFTDDHKYVALELVRVFNLKYAIYYSCQFVDFKNRNTRFLKMVFLFRLISSVVVSYLCIVIQSLKWRSRSYR